MLGFVEIFVAILFLAGMVTQVIIPLWTDTPLFPVLKGKDQLLKEAEEARKHLEDAQKEQYVVDLESKADNLRRQNEARKNNRSRG